MFKNVSQPSKAPMRRKLIAAIMLLSALFLAGCGGGGGGSSSGGGTPAPTTATIRGQLVNSATSTTLVGYIVRYGTGTSLSGTTNAQGDFTITVPIADLSSTATLTILDSSGNQVAIQIVNSAANSGNLGTVSVTLTGGPPGPPGI